MSIGAYGHAYIGVGHEYIKVSMQGSINKYDEPITLFILIIYRIGLSHHPI